jgi:Xaa-Pro dipeptidase
VRYSAHVNEAFPKLYTAHFADLERRYGAALEAAGYDAVAIHSGSLLPRSTFDDQYWPLRAVPHFQHWAPLAEPDAAIVFERSRKPRLCRLTVTSFWEAPPAPEADFFLASFDVRPIAAPDDVKGQLPAGKRIAFIGEDRARAAGWGFADADVNPKALLAALDALRTTKTPYEVACLAEANARAARGHEAVRAAFAGGDLSELELHLLYLKATGQDDPETPYKNIVAEDAHAATLHHVSYEKKPRGARSLLLDAGAACLGYCSDITRTWVKGGGAEASAFGALVAGVEAMQKRLCAAAKAGLPYEELHEESHRQVGAILREVGIAKTSAEEAAARGITRAFYPHGLGHSLGLQCHDVGCAIVKPKPENPFLRNTSTIVAGQVFTIEPGVYFIDGLLRPLREGPLAHAVDWKLASALAPLGGVRIEDDVVVLPEGGVRNLTRELLPLGGGAA